LCAQESESKAPAVAKLEAQIAERQRRVDALQRRINEVADRQFQAFSK
jgi:tetrahydromethanopterin S-methyltransferase subunit G